MWAHMLCCLGLQHCVDLCLGGLLLFLAGLPQVEAAAAAAAEMATLNWKPFIYGGMASIVAEFGRLRDAPRTHKNPHGRACDDILCCRNFDSSKTNEKEKEKSCIRFWLVMHGAQQSSLVHVCIYALAKIASKFKTIEIIFESR